MEIFSYVFTNFIVVGVVVYFSNKCFYLADDECLSQNIIDNVFIISFFVWALLFPFYLLWFLKNENFKFPEKKISSKELLSEIDKIIKK